MAKTKIITIEKNEKEILEIAEKAQRELDKNYNITFNSFMGIPTIVSVLVQELINYVGENNEELNFCELFNIGTDEEGLFFSPGAEMKLLTKSDGETEE